MESRLEDVQLALFSYSHFTHDSSLFSEIKNHRLLTSRGKYHPFILTDVFRSCSSKINVSNVDVNHLLADRKHYRDD